MSGASGVEAECVNMTHTHSSCVLRLRFGALTMPGWVQVSVGGGELGVDPLFRRVDGENTSPTGRKSWRSDAVHEELAEGGCQRKQVGAAPRTYGSSNMSLYFKTKLHKGKLAPSKRAKPSDVLPNLRDHQVLEHEVDGLAARGMQLGHDDVLDVPCAMRQVTVDRVFFAQLSLGQSRHAFGWIGVLRGKFIAKLARQNGRRHHRHAPAQHRPVSRCVPVSSRNSQLCLDLVALVVFQVVRVECHVAKHHDARRLDHAANG